MSARRRDSARHSPTLAPARLRGSVLVLILILVLPLAGQLLGQAASAADPPPVARQLDAARAMATGVAVQVTRHIELPVPLVEVASDPDEVLLDAADDGGTVALAARLGQDPTDLVLARADGSQLRIPFGGLLAAAFAPDGTWLAAVDGLGAIWTVASDDGATRRLADGPFLGPIVIEPGGTLLALAVPSVESPWSSHLVRVQPDGGTADRIGDEELVYGAHPLVDGSLAAVAHRPGGTVVLRLDPDGTAIDETTLGPGAVNVSVSSDGRVLAWEQGGEVLLVDRPGAAPRSLGAAAAPRVASQGTAILVDRGARSMLLGLDGSVLASLQNQASLLDCGECRP